MRATLEAPPRGQVVGVGTVGGVDDDGGGGVHIGAGQDEGGACEASGVPAAAWPTVAVSAHGRMYHQAHQRGYGAPLALWAVVCGRCAAPLVAATLPYAVVSGTWDPDHRPIGSAPAGGANLAGRAETRPGRCEYRGRWDNPPTPRSTAS